MGKCFGKVLAVAFGGALRGLPLAGVSAGLPNLRKLPKSPFIKIQFLMAKN